MFWRYFQKGSSETIMESLRFLVYVIFYLLRDYFAWIYDYRDMFNADIFWLFSEF